jgi:hypothetical protein
MERLANEGALLSQPREAWKGEEVPDFGEAAALAIVLDPNVPPPYVIYLHRRPGPTVRARQTIHRAQIRPHPVSLDFQFISMARG